MIHTVLEKLGINDEEVRAFLFLLENGEQTAGNLAKKTGISRPSLYGFLRKLEQKGLVIESQRNGVKTFLANSEAKLKSLLDDRIKDLEKGKLEFEKIFSQIKEGGLNGGPQFQFFEGKEGVQHVLRDVLLYRNIETRSYWPIKSMLEILGEDFFSRLNQERIRRKIYVRGIWPERQKVDLKNHPYMGVGENFFREIRIAPKEVDFLMGYWIYENKVAFISSKKESFGFIIESREFVEMLSSQFEVIWKLSKTMPSEPEYTNEFLKTI
jgi:sugar-specific transcriptional regulator TrmB